MELSRPIYAHDGGAVGPWAPWVPEWAGKRETGRGTGAGFRERKKEQSSSNNLRRKTYFTNYDIGMQDYKI